MHLRDLPVALVDVVIERLVVELVLTAELGGAGDHRVAEPEPVEHAAGGADGQDVRRLRLGDDLLEEVFDGQRCGSIAGLDAVLVEVKLRLHREHALAADRRREVAPEPLPSSRRARAGECSACSVAKSRSYAYQRFGLTPGVNTCASAATSSTVHVITTTSARGSAADDAGAGSSGAGVGAVPGGNAIGAGAHRLRIDRGIFGVGAAEVGETSRQEITRDLLAIRVSIRRSSVRRCTA